MNIMFISDYLNRGDYKVYDLVRNTKRYNADEDTFIKIINCAAYANFYFVQ